MTSAIEEAFRIEATGNFTMPQRMHIDHGDTTLLLMPCIADEFFATKLVSFFPHNSEKGHPALYGTVILNDGATGKPIALLNGAKLTALRTAGVGGVGMLYTTDRKVESAGVIGTGVQGFYQALFANSLLPLKQIYQYDLSLEHAEKTAEMLAEQVSPTKVEVCRNSRELVSSSELIITTTTSNTPVIPDDLDLLRNKHIVSVGSYKKDMRELPRAVFSLIDSVYVDTLHACHETGDLIYPLEQGWLKQERIVPMSKLVTGEEQLKGETTLFKSVGMALFDLIAARVIYQKALEKGVGADIEL
jgi:ornithine cyclodeaminase